MTDHEVIIMVFQFNSVYTAGVCDPLKHLSSTIGEGEPSVVLI